MFCGSILILLMVSASDAEWIEIALVARITSEERSPLAMRSGLKSVNCAQNRRNQQSPLAIAEWIEIQ